MEVAVTTARAPAVLKKVIYPYRERIHPSKVIFLGQSPLGREPSQRHLWSCTCKWNDLKVNILPRKIIVFDMEHTTWFKTSEHHFIGVMSTFHQANMSVISSHHSLPTISWIMQGWMYFQPFQILTFRRNPILGIISKQPEEPQLFATLKIISRWEGFPSFLVLSIGVVTNSQYQTGGGWLRWLRTYMSTHIIVYSWISSFGTTTFAPF